MRLLLESPLLAPGLRHLYPRIPTHVLLVAAIDRLVAIWPSTRTQTGTESSIAENEYVDVFVMSDMLL